MPQTFTSNRVVFSKGKQKSFILRAERFLKTNPEGLAKILGLSPRTIRDWKREKFSMSLLGVKTLSKLLSQKLPLKIKIEKPFWYVYKGAKKGGVAHYKKYGRVGGDPKYRAKKWREWWETEGKLKDMPIFHPLPFKKPKPSVELAEFIGIMMGDGGMSRWQIRITLHHLDDLAYGKYVVKLIRKLFGVSPSVYHLPKYSVNDITVSRVRMVQYLNSLGLPIGNKIKQQLDIPDWIKMNKNFSVACVRGLIDTDGSIFTHRYRVSGKFYSYKKLCFFSASRSLLLSAYNILKEQGLHPRLSQHKDVRLDSVADMERYFRVVGSHNPKHLRRYKI
jgi:hypothetical protein